MTGQESLRTQKVAVRGMTCVHCEILVERRFKMLPEVSGVRVDHRRGTAEFEANAPIDPAILNALVADDGYSVHALDDASAPANARRRNTARDLAEIGAAFVVLFGGYLALKQLHVLPDSITVLDQMSYGFVFLIGLVASVSSCMAVTGGLLVAVAAKYNEAAPDVSGFARMKPYLYFNAGRILSYTFLGGAVGALGATLTLSPSVNGWLTLAASAVMILLGLQMLHLLPSFGRFLPRLPKSIGHRVHDLATKETKGGAFLLGAATFFLPCGFTQALQLYVLAKGSFTVGALTMLAFTVGTLPALLSLSVLSSFASGGFQRHFLKFAGAAVILLGVLNIQYGLVLTGSSFTSAPLQTADAAPRGLSTPAGETQVIAMAVIDFGYEPYQFTVRQGVPVEWRIDAQHAAACGRILIAPRLGIRKVLSATGTTIITFTPQEAGEFSFNCSMGMMTPDAKFTVVPRA